MPIPSNDSPFWPTARLAIVGVILLVMLTMNYNRFDSRDVITIIASLAGLAGFDATKRMVEKAKKEPPEDESDPA